MSTFEGALIREQGVEFAVVIVKPSAMSFSQRDETLAEMSTLFPDVPTVIMSQDRDGTPKYYGRDDLSKFLANTPMENIPWAKYSLN